MPPRSTAFVTARKLQQDRTSARAIPGPRGPPSHESGLAPRALPRTYRLGAHDGVLSAPAEATLDALALVADAELATERATPLPRLGAGAEGPPLPHTGVSAVAWSELLNG